MGYALVPEKARGEKIMKTLELHGTRKNNTNYEALIKAFGIEFETVQQFMAEKLGNLYKDKKGVNFTVNKKLDGIPSIALPSEFTRLHFLALVEKNPALKQMERVKVLYAYLKENHCCYNYSECIKSCYNNRLNYQYADYAISTLRNLYILLTDEKRFIDDCTKAFLNLRYVRFSVSGDVNPRIWNVYKKIMKASPEVTFYLYTKNYKFFNDMKTTPRNLVVNVSIWGNTQKMVLNLYPNLAKHNFYHAYDKGFDVNSIEPVKGKKITEGICSKKQNGGKDVSCIKCKKCMTKKNYIITEIR